MLWTAFASSFVHSGTGHLLNNVGSYLLVMTAVYPLAVAAGWRRELAVTAIAVLAIVPLASAWITLLVLGPVTDYPSSGFSDVVSALLGTLLVIWFLALDRLGGTRSEAMRTAGPRSVKTAPRVDARWSGVAFALTLALVFGTPATVEYFPPVPLAAGACLLAALLGGLYFRLDAGFPRPVDVADHHEFCLVYGAGVLAAGVIGSLLLVPTGMNVWAHLVGYVVGFTVPFVVFVLPR